MSKKNKQYKMESNRDFKNRLKKVKEVLKKLTCIRI